jgi:hypothetical protein
LAQLQLLHSSIPEITILGIEDDAAIRSAVVDALE